MLPDERPAHYPDICLCMIVKNEAHVVLRAIESVMYHVDSIAIVDTGSTDGTQDTILRWREGMSKGPNLYLFEKTWRNFAHNRTEALRLCEGLGDYALILDADDAIRFPRDFEWPELTHDCYMLGVEYANLRYDRIHLLRLERGWQYEGVLHEHPEPIDHGNVTRAKLEAPTYVVIGGGARNLDPEKYKLDAKILETALIGEPDNTRYAFYLAQSYRDAGMLSEAIEAYEDRASMGGWDEEVYVSLLESAKCKERAHYPSADVKASYWRAHSYRPTRAEALWHLQRYMWESEQAVPAIVEDTWRNIAPSADLLFVEHNTYAQRSTTTDFIRSHCSER
jgi:hypothetical protein